jgi:hypothetical protein
MIEVVEPEEEEEEDVVDYDINIILPPYDVQTATFVRYYSC